MLTKKQLQKFVKLRLKSDFTSNMQFQSDLADAVGSWRAKPQELLGPVKKFTVGGFVGYQWDVPVKGEDMPTRMIEFGRCLALDERRPGQSDEQWIEDIRLFELVKRKAIEVKPEPKPQPA